MTGAAELICSSSERPLWLEMRRSGLGSSDASKILVRDEGLEVYLSKVRPTAERTDRWLRIGKAAEPLVRELFAAETGWPTVEDGQLWRSREHPWAICTPDSRAHQEAEGIERVVELKVGSLDWSDGVPRGPWVQVQHQHLVLGTQFGAVANLTTSPFTDLVWAEVDRDDDFIASVLLPTLEAFWHDHVEAGLPPSGVSAAAASALTDLFSGPAEDEVELPQALLEYDLLYPRLLTARRRAVDGVQRVRNKMRAALGRSKVGRFRNGRVWFLDKRGTLRRKG